MTRSKTKRAEGNRGSAANGGVDHDPQPRRDRPVTEEPPAGPVTKDQIHSLSLPSQSEESTSDSNHHRNGAPDQRRRSRGSRASRASVGNGQHWASLHRPNPQAQSFVPQRPRDTRPRPSSSSFAPKGPINDRSASRKVRDEQQQQQSLGQIFKNARRESRIVSSSQSCFESTGVRAHMITLEIPPGVDPASDWQPRPPAGQRWVDDGWGAYTLERIETPAPKIQPMQAPKVAMPIAPVRPRIRNWADEESDSTTVDDDPSSSIETPKIGEPVTDGSRPVELPVPMSRQSSQATAGFAEQLIDFDDVLSCAEIPALSPSSLTASAMLTPQYDGSERPNGNTETIRQTNGVNGPAASSSSSNGTAARSSSKSQPDTDDQPLDRQSGRPSAQLSRKASSPMMPAFMVSAPGKVIVFGEHAVVHGKSAMAASISLRSYLLVTSLSKSQRTVQLRFPDVGLDHTWEIDALPWNQFSAPDKKKSYYDFVTTLDPDLQDSLAPFLSDISPDAKPEQRKVHSAAAMAFLYLFLSLGSQSFPPAIYTLRSTIPIGAGLGSSASIAVCLSTALLLQIRALSGPHPDQPDSESALQLERINRWAFVAEMCIHGNPSGVDNTVSSHGKAVIFKRSDYRQPPTVIPLRYFPELPLLIVNTKQPRSTAAEVAKVAALKFSKPTITASILDAIHSVTEDAHALMTSPHFLPTPPPGLSQAPTPNPTPDSIRKLGQLMRINHGLLVSLGVSHPRLERVRAIIDHPAAAYGYTKLTGAGGGGCAISLVDPDTSDADLRAFCEQLRDEGFEVFRTRIGGGGVGVLWPAVLRTGNGEEGGEEIGLERFLSVRGTEGVERLVGVGEGRRREEWKYWRA